VAETGLIATLEALASFPYVAAILVAALVFDFINGFHDAANSIATIVGTRVLRPGQAVVWAAWWNFAAAWVFGVAVANTVAKFVHPEYVTIDVILAGLIGAIVWDLITWHSASVVSSTRC
jgi:PiT family inorganic phosphate transporter